nr:hypothetical protein [uncultured Methanoregula sp.]
MEAFMGAAGVMLAVGDTGSAEISGNELGRIPEKLQKNRRKITAITAMMQQAAAIFLMIRRCFLALISC